MKTKTKTLLITLLLLIGNIAFAQHSFLKGKIMDSTDKSPIEFASVVLLKNDSTYLSGTNSNLDGYFEISDISNAKNILSVSFMGYETYYKPLNSLRDSDTINIFLKQSSINLNEITIQARSVITKADRKIILPSEEQIKMSTDGIDLMRKMQLPRIMVDPISGEVNMSGNGEIQLRINGVQVTNAEIASIPTADIIRIEYHDDPGVRYGNADVVIDYITRNNESGGNINEIGRAHV